MMNTVNVLTKVGDTNLALKSFNDNQQGNRDAEQLFGSLITKFVLEQNLTMPLDEFESYLEDGYYERNNFSIFLIHSE